MSDVTSLYLVSALCLVSGKSCPKTNLTFQGSFVPLHLLPALVHDHESYGTDEDQDDDDDLVPALAHALLQLVGPEAQSVDVLLLAKGIVEARLSHDCLLRDSSFQRRSVKILS